MEQDRFWQYFDDESREYAKTMMDAEADYYENARALITPYMAEGASVLDIGNGGILNYDFSMVRELVCADISLSDRIVAAYKDAPNVRFVKSDILGMGNMESGHFDVVIVQKVIHHLAEKDYKTTRANCVRALNECVRVLRPGGRLLVLESTVRRWFERLEIAFFKPMMAACDLLKFDRVFQYSPGSLAEIISEEVENVEPLIGGAMQDIGMGRHVVFLGRKCPAWLLPCGVTFYSVEKRGAADERGNVED